MDKYLWRRPRLRYRLPALHTLSIVIQGPQGPPGKRLPADSTLWNQCLRALQAELPEQQFNTWIRPLQAVDEGDVLKLLAPNRFVVDWLQQHHIQRILELVERAATRGASRLAPGRLQRQPPHRAHATATSDDRPAGPCAGGLAAQPGLYLRDFVEGKSNQLARAAATQVGENPGKSYNPLFITAASAWARPT